ncbi:MAG: hypothetical protein Ta2F_18850 [Termitinemataceae bacterium]|nr:MAG: hypothetical protein Ta2F_18850 [Termitinemataceae bacterium]
MKKAVIFFALILTMQGGALYAENTFSLALGVEANQYSGADPAVLPDSKPLFAIGPIFGLDFRFGEMFSLGARAIWAIDLGAKPIMGLTTLELDVNLRWYFLRWPRLVNYYYLWMSKYHFFAQLDVGMPLLRQYAKDITDPRQETLRATTALSGLAFGATVGSRIFLYDDRLYIEPYLRYGFTAGKDDTDPEGNKLKLIPSSGLGGGILIGWTFHAYRGGY